MKGCTGLPSLEEELVVFRAPDRRVARIETHAQDMKGCQCILTKISDNQAFSYDVHVLNAASRTFYYTTKMTVAPTTM